MPNPATETEHQLAIAKPIIELAVAKLFACEADREDAAQNIMIQLWRRKLRFYDPTRGPLQPWLWKVCKRLALDQLNRKRKHLRTRPVNEDDKVGPDHTRTDRLALTITKSPESMLPPKRAGQLRDFQTCPDVGALAEKWRCSPAAVYQKIHRLRESVSEAAAVA